MTNIEALEKLKEQRKQALEQFENIRNTLIKLEGAIDVLEQNELSNVETETSIDVDDE